MLATRTILSFSTKLVRHRPFSTSSHFASSIIGRTDVEHCSSCPTVDGTPALTCIAGFGRYRVVEVYESYSLEPYRSELITYGRRAWHEFENSPGMILLVNS